MSSFMDNWEIDGVAREDRFGEWLQIHDVKDPGVISALRIIHVPTDDDEYEAAKSTLIAEEEAVEYFQEIVERISAECHVMTSLEENPNIVGYEEYAVEEKEEGFGWTIYIRVELLRPFLSYINEHPLTRDDVVRLGIDISNALVGCRRYEIIHRDLRPENIFVTEDGRFKLGGFDIANEHIKVTADMSKKSKGTYMAPEQRGGKNYSYAADQYSLGLIMYRFMNRDRLPFLPPAPEPVRYMDRENAQKKMAEGKTFPAPIDADDALAAIILKACSFKPERRYDSAQELNQALTQLYQEEV